MANIALGDIYIHREKRFASSLATSDINEIRQPQQLGLWYTYSHF